MTNCGIDIIEIVRIEAALSSNPAFLEKVFSQEEIEYFHQNGNRIECLAGFFAAKEAFSKYLGTGISGFGFADVSVCHDSNNAPFIVFKGKRADVSLSISHNKTTAVAIVIGSSELSGMSALNPCSMIDAEVLRKMQALIPDRFEDSCKSDFGKILVIAGSCGMTGAAVLSAYSALRTGSGLVTLATPHTERAVAASFYPEIMTLGLRSENGIISSNSICEILSAAEGKDAIVFGPGIGQAPHISLILAELLTSFSKTLVIDADGLNALSTNPDILKKRACDVIITPHPGEMSRLTGKSVEQIQKARSEIALQFAKDYDVCAVLKGNQTIVADTNGAHFVNPTGSSALATAGTGDVLSGVIASLAGQGLYPFGAASLGVFLHGMSGDLAAINLGKHGVIASDVAENIPYAINNILNLY